ncbi:UvrB/UvrC motif-containing protein [Peptoniphilus catoniae]|uniref:UvrB/UvrC motif-containing protein n=1 Tax=Peptoniphilus catoniae TaxID=1660341 RepID=UPI0010FEF054|nr:UvrB/UvrC motif-containing protein [Peptoniphilus catoniae]
MLCDNCKKNEAMISYTKMIGNEIEEIHLCADCAEKKMREDLVFNSAVTDRVESFLKELFKLTGNDRSAVTDKKCKTCNTSFKELEENRLGCENCYENFKDEIQSMLTSLKFSSKHKGKIPKSAGNNIIYRRDEQDLMDKLSKAIELENYEDAAVFRDKLKELREKNEYHTL